MIHHIIPKHEWKKRFGTLIGLNDADNLANLTTEQHVHVHQLLYELNGNEYDRIAYLGLSKVIGKEEAIRQAVIFTNTGSKGRKHTVKWKLEKSIRMKGNQNGLGSKHPHTEEFKKIMSIRQTGTKRGPYKRTAI